MPLGLQELKRKAHECFDEARKMHEGALKDDKVLEGDELTRAEDLRRRGEEYQRTASEMESLRQHELNGTPMPPAENQDAGSNEQRGSDGAIAAERLGSLSRDELRNLFAEFAPELLNTKRTNGANAPAEYRTRYGAPDHEKRFSQWLDGLRYFATDQVDPDRLNNEQRSVMQAFVQNLGGYITVGEQFMNQLIKSADDAMKFRQLATVIPVASTASLGVPTLDTDIDDFDEGGELTEAEEDNIEIGKRELRPHKLKSKVVRVSRDLLANALMPVQDLVMNRIIYKRNSAQENHFMTGSGANQSLGLFTASNDGIGTSYDISTGNTTALVKFDNLKTIYWKLHEAYRSRAVWVFHPDILLQLDKEKDGQGQYLWNRDVTTTGQLQFLGRPVIDSRFAPNTVTASAYVGIFGDLSFYWIAEATNMTLQVLQEKYTLNNQIGLLAGNIAFDGMPILGEAFRRVQLAAG